MDKFNYKNGQLYCENVNVSDLAKKVGTPFYLYSQNTLQDHFNKIKDAFQEINPLISYSIKNCSNIHILKILKNLGAGMDVVSGGELLRALDANVDPSKIVFAGVGKSSDEIKLALQYKIAWINVESADELENVARLATEMKTQISVAIRINPDVYDPKTHIKTTTGIKDSKFGIDLLQAKGLYIKYKSHPYVKLTGLHIHIGSPIYSAGPYVEAINKVLGYITELENEGVKINSFDIGGGFMTKYHGDEPIESFTEYSIPIIEALKPFTSKGGKVILEPGRSIAANAGILVSQVLYRKKGIEKSFVILNSGMSHLIRPAFYDAYHFIWPVKVNKEYQIPANRVVPTEVESKLQKYDVVGPICESSDFFAKDRPLPEVQDGDLIAVFTAGSYSMSMASQYNSIPRPAEILVNGDRARIIRQREIYEDLVALERDSNDIDLSN